MNRTLVYLAALSVAACGGSDSGTGGAGSESPSPASTVYQTAEGFCASTPKFSGGDLTGAWTVIAACGISTNNPENCADVKLTLSLAAQGTVTFNADLTGSIDVTVALTKKSTLPTSCSSKGDCASIQSDLALEVGTGAGASATCAPSSTDSTRCDCVQVYSPDVMKGSGSYKFELPTYIMSPDLGLQGAFVVQGNTLRLDGPAERGTEFDLIATR